MFYLVDHYNIKGRECKEFGAIHKVFCPLDGSKNSKKSIRSKRPMLTRMTEAVTPGSYKEDKDDRLKTAGLGAHLIFRCSMHVTHLNTWTLLDRFSQQLTGIYLDRASSFDPLKKLDTTFFLR